MRNVITKNKSINEFLPKAFNGDKVFVHNYRKKYKNTDGYLRDANIWEWGTVNHVRTNWYKDEENKISFSHRYDIILDRKTISKYGKEGYLFVTVEDETLQTIEGK